MTEQKAASLYQCIYALVKQIPPGYVSTYGCLGRKAGCTARTVGFALSALPASNDVPWQRIVNSRGMISPRADGGRHLLQRDLLEIEGVCFDATNRIDLNAHGWNFP
jgi:methylated-DNA-protein-cysteine methyltransferase-like protein